MNSLVVPGTNITVTDGSVVMLSRFPGKKWVAHYGWYKYAGQQMMGWYFCSIPENTVVPVNDQDLSTLTVISSGSNCACPVPGPAPTPTPRPYPPCPDPEDHNQFSDQDKWELDRAFITVNTIAERDALNDRLLPDGKLVRVNNDGDSPAYFRWNQVLQIWEEEFFGASIAGNFLTEDRAKELFAGQSELTDTRAVADNAASAASLAAEQAKSAFTEAEIAKTLSESAMKANTELTETVNKLDGKVVEAVNAANGASVAADDAKNSAQTAQEAAQAAQNQVQEIQQNLEQIVTETVEQVVSDEKIAAAVASALNEKLPDAVEAEVAEQLGDADWGTLT